MDEVAEAADGKASDLQDRVPAHDLARLLLEVNNAIVTHLDQVQLLKAISACLRRELPHDFVGIALYDPETNQLRTHALDFPLDQGFASAGFPIPLQGTPAGLAFTTQQPVIVNKSDGDRFPAEALKQLAARGSQSGCAVPLISHGRALGTLNVGSVREGAFGASEISLLSGIAGQVAIAMENALNFEASRKAQDQAARERDRADLLLKINNTLVSQLDLRQLLKAISSSLQGVIHHEFAGLALHDPESDQLIAHALEFGSSSAFLPQDMALPVEGTLGGLAFKTGQPVYLPRPDPQRFSSGIAKSFAEGGIQSIYNVPLIAHGKPLGVFAVGSLRQDALTRDDLELISHIANQVAIAVENALSYREIEKLKNKLAEEKLYLEDEIRSEMNFEEIIGGSASLQRILKQVQTVAQTDSTVLIRGETGTGKELIARAIHALSKRRERTMVKINCAAIPTGLLESELFGHEKGAFTGAIAQRIGRFELAHLGTLFLDEVGDIPLELQSKLLRVLQEQEFERLGSTHTRRVNVRLVAATNCDLSKMVEERQFRRDLFYRLNVFPVTLPPLRERQEDIPSLVRYFASRYAQRMNRKIETIPSDSMKALQRWHWPGNVRELENLIERAVILSQGSVLEVPLAELQTFSSEAPPMTLNDSEREHIVKILHQTKGRLSGPGGAAELLGMKRTTLQHKMKKLGITTDSIS